MPYQVNFKLLSDIVTFGNEMRGFCQFPMKMHQPEEIRTSLYASI